MKSKTPLPDRAVHHLRLSGIAHTLQPFIPAPVYRAVCAHVGRRNANRWLKEQGVFDLALEVAEHFGYTVQSGPFKGMKYTRPTVLSRHATPTLIGQYEREIYPSLMEAAGRVEAVIDIGHAEGYYAVGLALLGKRVIVAETPEENQTFVRRFLGTHRVEIIDHPREPVGAERIAFLGADAPRMATEYRSFQQWLIASSNDATEGIATDGRLPAHSTV
jgi:hypothetical protein